MRLSNLLLLLAISVLAFSCIEESNVVTTNSPAFNPNNPTYTNQRQVVNASELVGAQFGMAEISLQGGPGVRERQFSMPSCYLSVFEAVCDNNCISQIDENDSFFRFNNEYVTREGSSQQLIKFNAMSGETGTGAFANFLRNEVFPVLDEGEFTVERDDQYFYLSCTDCPLEYNSATYQDRFITLRVR